MQHLSFSSAHTRSGASHKLVHSFNVPSLHNFTGRLPHLWNSLPIIDLSLSFNTIKYSLKHHFHNHLCLFTSAPGANICAMMSAVALINGQNQATSFFTLTLFQSPGRETFGYLCPSISTSWMDHVGSCYWYFLKRFQASTISVAAVFLNAFVVQISENYLSSLRRSKRGPWLRLSPPTSLKDASTTTLPSHYRDEMKKNEQNSNQINLVLRASKEGYKE